MRRPWTTLGLGLALLAVNLIGLVLAVLPFLTMTIAYSALASARFALPLRAAEEAMANVIFEDVWKRFDSTVAVQDFSLEIEDAEFMVLVGRRMREEHGCCGCSPAWSASRAAS